MSALPLKMEGNQPRTWNAQRLRCARFCLCGVKSRTTALPAKFAPLEVVINKANEADVRLNLCAQKNQCKKLWNLISHVHSVVNRVAQSSHGDFIWLHCAATSLNQKVTNGLTSVGGCRLFSEFALTERSVRLLPACPPPPFAFCLPGSRTSESNFRTDKIHGFSSAHTSGLFFPWLGTASNTIWSK